MKRFFAAILAAALLLPGKAVYPAAEKHEYVLFDDSYGNGVTTTASGVITEIQGTVLKNGSSALRYRIPKSTGWRSFTLEYTASVKIPESEKNDYVLKMWVKLPKSKVLPQFYLKTTDSKGYMQTNIPLEFYIQDYEIGEWKRLQIPLSELNGDGRYSNGSMGKTNFERFNGVGCKVDSAALGEDYIFYMDDVSVTNSFNPALNTTRLTDRGAAAVEQTPRTDKNGEYIYGTLFSDTAADGAFVGGAVWSYDRREKSEGICSIRTDFAAGANQTAVFYPPERIFINEENLKGSALQFDIKTDKTENLSFRLYTHNKKAYELYFDVPVSDYAADTDGWQTVMVPFSKLPLLGSVFIAESNVISSRPVDWTKITGFGLTASLKDSAEGRRVYLDNIRFCRYDEPEVQEAVKLLSEQEFGLYKQSFTYVDISGQANRDFRDEVKFDKIGGWIDQGPEDLRGFKLKGVNLFNGVPFNIIDPKENNSNACIVMQGQSREPFPDTVTVPVGKKAGGIYFLHSAAWIDKSYAGDYIINYADKTNSKIPLNRGREIADWQVDFSSDRAATAYLCWNENGQKGGFQIFGWENPYPDKEIESITVRTPGDRAFIMIAGITLTDTKPAFISAAAEQQTYDREIINPDTSDWIAVKGLPDTKLLSGTALDASWALDAPAGKHGFITADGENLRFEDGTGVRFWGVDVVADACFPTKENADILVGRIAAAGFNLVRFHHMDASWSKPSIFGTNANTTRILSDDSLSRFEYFWAELKKRGIYIMVDPLCYRRTTVAGDGVDSSAGFKSMAVVDERLRALQKEYAEQLLLHMNPYTNTCLRDDPSLVFIDIINEDSLFWDNAIQWGLARGERKDILDKDFTEFLKQRYKTTQALRSAWTEEDKKGLPDDESLETLVRVSVYFNLEGNSTLSAQSVADMKEYIIGVHRKYYTELADFYKNTLKMKCLISGSNAPTYEYADLYANTAKGLDFTDQHSYFGGTEAGNGQYLKNGGRFVDLAHSSFDEDVRTMLDVFGDRAVKGYPYVQSEWNQPEPNIYSAESLPLMAAYGSLNSWNPVYFAFLQADMPRDAYMMILYNMYEVPTKSAIAPACGMMFLRGDVKPSELKYYAPVSLKEAIGRNSASPDIPWDMKRIAKTGVSLVDNENVDPYSDNAALLEYLSNFKDGRLVAVNNQLRWDKNNKTLEINTGCTQGYIGFVGGNPTALDDVEMELDSSHASVMLTSLSNDPIKSADRLLLSAVGRWRLSGQLYSEDARTMLYTGETPMLLEPVVGKVRLKSNYAYKVYCLDESGQRIKEAPVRVLENGMTEITLCADNEAVNYELVRQEKINETVFRGAEWNAPTIQRVTEGAADTHDCEWAGAAINKLIYDKIAETDSENRFRPDAAATAEDINGWFKNAGIDAQIVTDDTAVTRAELLLAVGRYLQNADRLSYDKGSAGFADITEKHGALAQYLAALAATGIVTGDENGCIEPDRQISRAEAAVIVYRTLRAAGQ